MTYVRMMYTSISACTHYTYVVIRQDCSLSHSEQPQQFGRYKCSKWKEILSTGWFGHVAGHTKTRSRLQLLQTLQRSINIETVLRFLLRFNFGHTSVKSIVITRKSNMNYTTVILYRTTNTYKISIKYDKKRK